MQANYNRWYKKRYERPTTRKSSSTTTTTNTTTTIKKINDHYKIHSISDTNDATCIPHQYRYPIERNAASSLRSPSPSPDSITACARSPTPALPLRIVSPCENDAATIEESSSDSSSSLSFKSNTRITGSGIDCQEQICNDTPTPTDTNTNTNTSLTLLRTSSSSKITNGASDALQAVCDRATRNFSIVHNYISRHLELSDMDYEDAFEICLGAAALTKMRDDEDDDNDDDDDDDGSGAEEEGSESCSESESTSTSTSTSALDDDIVQVKTKTNTKVKPAKKVKAAAKVKTTKTKAKGKVAAKRKRDVIASSSLSLSSPFSPPDKQQKQTQAQKQRKSTTYPSRLAVPGDEKGVNSLHCFVRSELLDIIIVPGVSTVNTSLNMNINEMSSQENDHTAPSTSTTSPAKTMGRSRRRTRNSQSASEASCSTATGICSSASNHATNEPNNQLASNNLVLSPNGTGTGTSDTGKNTNSSIIPQIRLFPGRVGLQCTHCSHISTRKDQHKHKHTSKHEHKHKMATFYPKSLSELYRSVCTWQRIHFKECQHIPVDLREKYAFLKESDKTRGKRKYWAISAQELGLVDVSVHGRSGIRFSS